MSAIPEAQAKMLNNKTMRIPDLSPATYAAGLDVFHQLHCLNFVRKALYPEHYNDSNRHHAHATTSIPPQTPGDLSEPFDHLDHCINNVREALMCNADLTPVVVQWDPDTQWHYAHLDVVHTCKDWVAIQGWAVDHAMTQEADLSKHVE
ncbi:hypothetical protein FIBSPDRAFT_824591 [Athelia psychrophila]|uniref:Tat pathway signal sequence n=1 Tax=Athelia psychrophila TaxID=1759441 RepID=A0A166L1P9_9AGAM|nr:hypothetical protein FIBSPDRAFT_824591 [Fibularhizoctonia sp. CBS 109695]